jgi:hypothetical protein
VAIQNLNVGPAISAGHDPILLGTVSTPAHDAVFLRMIEDTADKFWRCDRCLSLSHEISA